jgi:23S rRNA (guanosine2251-2'-O)-methyltransferase
MTELTHPRDRYLTVYGRKPTLEALREPGLAFGRLLVADNARGEQIGHILKAAKLRAGGVERCSAKYVNRISKNARQDQGVALDVIAPNMMALDALMAQNHQSLVTVLLDGVDTPGNVGMIIRNAVATNIGGVVLPRRGCPEVSPLVIKASAGTAFRAPIVKAESSEAAVRRLATAGHTIYGLRVDSGLTIYDMDMAIPSTWVLGNETTGISEAVAQYVTEWVTIPMSGSAESLNVACASAVVMFEIQRRHMANLAPTGA